MVLLTVFRDSPLDSKQARWRDRHVRLDPAPVRSALARHVKGAQRAFPPNIQVDLLAPTGRLPRAWLGRSPSAGGIFPHHRPRGHVLLFLSFPCADAASGKDRAAAATPDQHRHARTTAGRRAPGHDFVSNTGGPHAEEKPNRRGYRRKPASPFSIAS